MAPPTNYVAESKPEHSFSTAMRQLFHAKGNLASGWFTGQTHSDKQVDQQPKKGVTFKNQSPAGLEERKNRTSARSPKSTAITKARKSKKRSAFATSANFKSGAKELSSKSKLAVAPKQHPQEEKKAHGHSAQPGRGKTTAGEHPLSSVLKSATLAYETHITTQAPQALNKAASDIEGRLNAVDETSLALLSAYSESLSVLTIPFKEEKLLITIDRGTDRERKVHATIGDRVEAFAEFIKAKEDKANNLWKQWEKATSDLEKLRSGLENCDWPEGYAATAKKLEEDYRAKRRQVLLDYDEDCAKLAKRAKKSEREYEAAVDRQRRALAEYIQLETDIRHAGDEYDEDEEEDDIQNDGEDEGDAKNR